MKKPLSLFALALFFVACGTTTEEVTSPETSDGVATQKVTIFDPSRLSETTVEYQNIEFKLLNEWSINTNAELQEKDGISKVALSSPAGSLVLQMNAYGYELSPMPLMTLANGIVVHQNPCGGALACHILETDSALYEVAFAPHEGWPEVTEEDLLQILTSVEYTQ